MMMDKKQMGYFKNKRLKKNKFEGFLISRGFDYNSYQTENYLKKQLVNIAQMNTNYITACLGMSKI